MPTMRLSAAQKAMLEQLDSCNGVILARQWDALGTKAPDQMIAKGLVRRGKHPTVKDRSWGDDRPAASYELTDEGKALAAARRSQRA